MLPLRELQLRFAEAVLGSGAPVSSAHAPLPIRGGRLNVAQRLRVYRNSVLELAMSALAATHPVVRRLVGEPFFSHTAHRYLQAWPSTSANLHNLGHRFAEFLETFTAAGRLPYLPDVARLEWSCHEAFHAADGTPTDARSLAALDRSEYARVTLELHPACRLLRSRYPIVRIWEANQPGRDGDEGVDLSLGGGSVLVYRSELRVEMRQLSLGEFVLLRSLGQNRALAEASEWALCAEPELDLAASLATLVSRGVFVGLARTAVC